MAEGLPVKRGVLHTRAEHVPVLKAIKSKLLTIQTDRIFDNEVCVSVSSITGKTAEAELGKIYRGKVVTIKEFGAFVEFLPGKEGLVHISELANFRVKQTEDIVKMGDEIWVKCLGVDEKGRVKMSRKAYLREMEKRAAAAAGASAPAPVPAQE